MHSLIHFQLTPIDRATRGFSISFLLTLSFDGEEWMRRSALKMCPDKFALINFAVLCARMKNRCR